MAVLTPADSVNRVELDLEFRTFADDGVILYSGSADGADADFLSVALVDGFVEFRYDLGSGAVSIRSPERVRPGHWHRIVAARYVRDESPFSPTLQGLEGSPQVW